MKDSKSTSGYFVILGGVAMELTRHVITQLTMESEFIASDKVEKEAKQLRFVTFGRCSISIPVVVSQLLEGLEEARTIEIFEEYS